MTDSDMSAGQRKRAKTGPSIADVARLAGVSAQTVSRVSTGAQRVHPDTRQRVLVAMEQLGYSPNTAGRALRNGNYQTIGVIAHQLSRTGESRTVEAVVEAARMKGYTTTLVDVGSPSSTDVGAAVRNLTHQSIDGLIIIRAETATPGTLALPRGLPVAVSDSRFIGHHPAVGADQIAGTQAAVEHLLELGHPTVHHFAGPKDSAPGRIRAQAWRSTLDVAGCVTPPVRQGDWSPQSGYRLGLAAAEDPDLTAIFAANDEMAVGAILALYERGRTVPGDVSVVGFDDIGLSAFTWPPLTTIRQNFQQIGIDLVDLIIRQIQGEQLTDHRSRVPTELVIRGSTAST